MRNAVFAAAALAMASPGMAQDASPPDPATVSLPDMTPNRSPEVIEEGWKHFYFHKAGVSYEQAYADFADCYRFLPVANQYAVLPMFAPWSETPGGRTVVPVNPYGLIGVGIGALVAGPIERRARQSRLRRCMEPRGYVRYPLAERIWEQLVDDYSPGSIAAQALAAAGPTPDLEPVTR